MIRKLGLDRLTRRPKGHGWPYWTKVPWQAVYNAACLCALPDAGKPQEAPPRGDIALTLLRLAIEDPDCELDYPYEWINADPGLQELRENHSPTQKWLKELQASSVSSPVP